MYYFCNFIDEEIKGISKDSVNFIDDSKVEDSKPVYCYKVKGNNRIGLMFSSEKTNGVELDLFEGYDSTEENPIILVATKKIQVYSGVRSHIRYIPMGNCFLVALIEGCISIENNGNMIPLSRNYSGTVNGNVIDYDFNSIRTLNTFKDKGSDMLISDYVMSDCTINYTLGKQDSKMVSVSFNKDKFIFFNKVIFLEARKVKEEKQKALSEEKERNKERYSEIEREWREKEEKKQHTTKKVKTDSEKASEGAKDFLKSLGLQV